MAARLGAHSLERSEQVKYFTTGTRNFLSPSGHEISSTYLIDLVVYVFWLMHMDNDTMSTKINKLTDHLLKVF